jgi:hypothetical protein
MSAEVQMGSFVVQDFKDLFTATLGNSTGKVKYVRFEVFTAVTMKNCVFWDATPCGSYKNRRFGGT